MKKTTKIIALLLTAVMLSGVLCGCGREKTSREMGKYTYWAVVDSAVQQTHSSYDEMLMYQEMAKRTGIEIDFIHPTAGSTGSEAFQILLTSSDIPDMVEYTWKQYPGGADAAIDNKVIISLNEYLKDNAPDYYDYMEGEKNKANGGLYKLQSMTEKGNYYGFNTLSIGTYRAMSGLYIRKDLLDKWGVKVPVTIADWETVLAAAKANGIKYPITGVDSLFALAYIPLFNTAWNVGKEFHMENGKVVFSLDTPGYKEYVKTMASWFKKGYIDPDYVTNNGDAVLGKITGGQSIAAFGFLGSAMGKILPAMENDPDFQIVACKNPVLKEGDTPRFQNITGESNDPVIAISVACGKENEERYKEAISWCNYLYSEEGKVLTSFGVEGKTFTKTEKKPEEIGADGEKYKYTYTDLIVNDNDPGREKIGAHSVQAALYHFMRPANGPGLTQHNDYLLGFYPYQEQKDALALWNENLDIVRNYVLPPFTLTDKETERKNAITAKTYDALNATVSNIILNKADISTYDAAVAKAKKDGYDELKEIYQTALDRYNSRLKK